MTNDKQRERLVELLEEADQKVQEYILENDHMDWIPKLKELSEVRADYLLTNGAVVPPCKVGQDIYTIQGGRVSKQFVLGFSIHKNGKTYFEYIPYDKKGNVQWFYVASYFTEDAIGKTVFLSREESEKALGGVQG